MFLVMSGLVPGIHVFLRMAQNSDVDGRDIWAQRRASRFCAAMTATNAFPAFRTSPANRLRPACFPALLAPNKDREIGGGRASRQPGQVRKEAALTRSGSGRSSVSYLLFRANRARWANPSCAGFRSLSASRLRETIN